MERTRTPVGTTFVSLTQPAKPPFEGIVLPGSYTATETSQKQESWPGLPAGRAANGWLRTSPSTSTTNDRLPRTDLVAAGHVKFQSLGGTDWPVTAPSVACT